VRIESALQASAHHYERTGRCFYITPTIVDSGNNYEELEDAEQFGDTKLLLPKGLNIKQLRREQLHHLTEMTHYSPLFPQGTTRCPSQVPSQNNANSQNAVNLHQDTWVNSHGPGQSSQTSQSQGNGSRVPVLAQTAPAQVSPNVPNLVTRPVRLPANIVDLASDTSYKSQFFGPENLPPFTRDTDSMSTPQFTWNSRFTLRPIKTCDISQLHTEGMHSASLIQLIDEIFEKESAGIYPWNVILGRTSSSQEAFNGWWNVKTEKNVMDQTIICNTQVIDYDNDRDTSGVFISPIG
jgi:hypothetical protein